MKIRYISKKDTCIVLCVWQLKHCFHLSHLYIHTHTRTHTYTHAHTHTHTYTYTHIHTHTHTHTHSHRFKFYNFSERSRNQIHEQLIQQWYAKFNAIKIQVFFNENIRSNKDSGQIERNELAYLHYQNKMTEKYKIKKFIFGEVSCF